MGVLRSSLGRFTPVEKAALPIPNETCCAQEPVWMHRRADKSLPPAGNRTIVQRSIACILITIPTRGYDATKPTQMTLCCSMVLPTDRCVGSTPHSLRCRQTKFPVPFPHRKPMERSKRRLLRPRILTAKLHRLRRHVRV